MNKVSISLKKEKKDWPIELQTFELYCYKEFNFNNYFFNLFFTFLFHNITVFFCILIK